MALNKNGLERLWMHTVARLGEKVNIEEGKGLSSNDYTHLEKEKLASIEDGAQINVQSDWRNMDEDHASFILNKPVSYEQISIDWDGNTEGHVLAFAEGATAPFACKVSDIYCNPTQLIGGTVTVQGTEEYADITETFTISLDNVSGMPDSEGNFGGVYYNEGSQFVSVEKPCTLRFFYFELILPEPGTYFACHEPSYYISNLTLYNETLNPVILPVATSETLGAVKPIVKTEDMTRRIGVDNEGALWVSESPQANWSIADETDPAYIANKPVTSSGFVIEWDGDIEGHTIVVGNDTGAYLGGAVKISDNCYTKEDLINGIVTFTTVSLDGTLHHFTSDRITEENLGDLQESADGQVFSIEEILFFVNTAGAAWDGTNDYVFPETGVYSLYQSYTDGNPYVKQYISKFDSYCEKLNSNIIPIATDVSIGGVMPVTKTSVMTQSVGVDENGGLWTSENVQADWNQTDETQKDFIKNKPIFSAITETEIDEICTSTSAITVFGDATLGTTMI